METKNPKSGEHEEQYAGSDEGAKAYQDRS